MLCMSFGSGRKPEYLEKPHIYMGRTQKFHLERSQNGFKPGSDLQGGKGEQLRAVAPQLSCPY